MSVKIDEKRRNFIKTAGVEGAVLSTNSLLAK